MVEMVETLERPRTAEVADEEPHGREPFMCDRQKEWFRARLGELRREILQASGGTLDAMRQSPIKEPDLAERAASETDWSAELRTRDRQRKLLSKISQAIGRLDDGEFGYCVMTGEEIPLARLIARPIATMTVKAQELYERRERMGRPV